jgi:hypothetical protein
MDGETYHFACGANNVGWMAGKTWSPDPDTAPGRLVALCHLLYDYVELGEIQSDLLQKFHDAAEWFGRPD